MTWVAEGPRTVWLFTRGRESVRLEVVRQEHGVRLLVKGPGGKRAVYDFADLVDLVQHQSELEQHIVSQGFSLETFTTERRRAPRS